MSTALTTTPKYHPQLPAFLQDPSLFDATDKAIAGIGGGQPPYISIKSAKWRLVGADGEESLVNQLHLDVIVLAGNEHVSKTYYAGAYDPSSDTPAPPTCFSDNGSAPSSQAMSPQSDLCASCKHNAWGSKVTPSGSQIKACSDSKKLAVVLAADTPIVVNGAAGVAKALDQVYLLRVPAASMRGWRDYAKDIRARGVPIIGVVSRLQFNAEASYPAVLFQAAAFVTEAVYKASRQMLEAPEIAEAIGANDVPFAGTAPQTTAALPQTPPAHLAGTAPAVVVVPAQMPPAGLPTPTPPAAASAETGAGTSGTRRRGRPPAAAPAAVPAPVAPVAAAPAAPLFPAAGGPAIQPAQATSSELDALLASAMEAK